MGATCSVLTCKKEEEKKPQGHLEVTDEGRACTDVFCLIFYVLFGFLLFIIIGIVGYTQGNPYRVVYASDYKGQVCGTGTRGKYAYYPRLSDDIAEALTKSNVNDPTKLSPSSITFYGNIYKKKNSTIYLFFILFFYIYIGICMNKCPSRNDVICNYDVPVPSQTDFIGNFF